ncbi:MAG: glycosyltransferase [Sphingobacteriales bacterium]|nr:MAG: glycosyltransferase [Sphingobacteriales bacterium]TAF82307.1 MAG: glycosyltransferase [Sphingobacteriales bacterium]
MKLTSKLAIVIPAYKDVFLQKTLESIAKQTCNDFNLYIGDDCSPNNLQLIIEPYKSQINIIYKKFETNLGGLDLVAHWNRCIALTQNEEWIWLFSDDDILAPNCVACFYNFISTNTKVELVHFDVKVIDKNGLEILDIPVNAYPKVLSSVQFFEEKTKGNIQSFVVEYIFKRTLYDNEGGFANFDLAWCADDATWIKFASKNGIYTIKDTFVYWRYSGINISSITTDLVVLDRKLNAKLAYLKWVKLFFLEKNIQCKVKKHILIKWFMYEITINKSLSTFYRGLTAFKYSKNLIGFFWAIFSVFYVIISQFKQILLYKYPKLFNYFFKLFNSIKNSSI